MEGPGRPEVSPYGPPVAPDEAPEAITQAVASLPPEQMFELMKQMKVHAVQVHNLAVELWLEEQCTGMRERQVEQGSH